MIYLNIIKHVLLSIHSQLLQPVFHQLSALILIIFNHQMIGSWGPKQVVGVELIGVHHAAEAAHHSADQHRVAASQESRRTML